MSESRHSIAAEPHTAVDAHRAEEAALLASLGGPVGEGGPVASMSHETRIGNAVLRTTFRDASGRALGVVESSFVGPMTIATSSRRCEVEPEAP